MKKWTWRMTAHPSAEARAAHGRAKEASERADAVYGERAEILRKNHFAERIRLIYEGNR